MLLLCSCWGWRRRRWCLSLLPRRRRVGRREINSCAAVNFSRPFRSEDNFFVVPQLICTAFGREHRFESVSQSRPAFISLVMIRGKANAQHDRCARSLLFILSFTLFFLFSFFHLGERDASRHPSPATRAFWVSLLSKLQIKQRSPEGASEQQHNLIMARERHTATRHPTQTLIKAHRQLIAKFG